MERYIKAQKVIMALGTGVMEELNSLDVPALKARILKSSENLEESERAKDDDVGLAEAKLAAKNAAAPYGDAKKLQSAIISWCGYRIKELGKG